MALNGLRQPVVLLCVHYRVLPARFHNIRIAKPYRLKGKQSVTDITADLQANSLIISLSIRPLSVSVLFLHHSFSATCHAFSMTLFVQLYFSCTPILLISSSPFLCFWLITPSCTMHATPLCWLDFDETRERERDDASQCLSFVWLAIGGAKWFSRPLIDHHKSALNLEESHLSLVSLYTCMLVSSW